MLRAGLWHRGITRLVQIEAPAAGKEWSVSVPTTPEGVWWRVKSYLFQLTASGAVANRNVRVLIDPGGDSTWPYLQALTAQNHTAGQVVRYFGGEFHTGVIANGPPIVVALGSCIPADLRLQPGHRIRSETALMDAGDQYSGVVFAVEEWIYEPAGERVPNAGDGSDRVDFTKLNETMTRLEQVLRTFESAQATP